MFHETHLMQNSCKNQQKKQGNFAFSIDNKLCLCYNKLALTERGVNFFIKRGIIMRTNITLVCTECKGRNYDTDKNKKNDPDRMEMKKFCPKCKKHTIHKEGK